MLSVPFFFGSSRADSAQPVPSSTPVRDTSATGNCRWKTIPPEAFVPLSRSSGKVSYYTVRSDPDSVPFIHADYVPPAATVQLGFRFSETESPVWKIEWDWRIDRAPHGSSELLKEKNDSGASVYLVFRDALKTYVLKYLYSSTLPVGTVISNPSSNPLQKMFMIVAGSGKNGALGTWEHVMPDFQSDFKRLFATGKCPSVSGIGILSDGDQTGSHVVAGYRNFCVCGK